MPKVLYCRDVEIKRNEEARSKERREDAKDDTMIESMFHFYPADPYYISWVEGLDPKKEELHLNYYRMEPRSGVPTDVTARFQINILVTPLKGISILKNVSTSFFPNMWFEDMASVRKKLVFQMDVLASFPDIFWGKGWADNLENACFQPENVPQRSGVYNVSLCRFGALVHKVAVVNSIWTNGQDVEYERGGIHMMEADNKERQRMGVCSFKTLRTIVE